MGCGGVEVAVLIRRDRLSQIAKLMQIWDLGVAIHVIIAQSPTVKFGKKRVSNAS